MPSSYDAIPDLGLLYDNVPLYQARQDIAFYVSEATAAQGPVLELGCGTGRVLLPIARAGCPIVGLDRSANMLATCRTQLAREPSAVQERVRLEQGDIADFDLHERYPLIIAPFRVVQHLISLDDQVRFLAAVERHLSRAGRLIFDVFNPLFSVMVAADGTEHEDTPLQTLPGGRTFRRTARVLRVRWVDQVNEIELIYYIDGKRYVHAFEMRWFLAAELHNLLARAGFRLRAMYGDFARGPVVDGCPELIVVADRDSTP